VSRHDVRNVGAFFLGQLKLLLGQCYPFAQQPTCHAGSVLLTRSYQTGCLPPSSVALGCHCPSSCGTSTCTRAPSGTAASGQLLMPNTDQLGT